MERKVATIGELKPGSFVLIEDVPCKVVSTTHSKPGKHGSAKIRMEAVGIVDGRKRAIVQPADARIDVPIIEKRNAQVISISDNKASVMDTESYETFDMDIPEEFQGKVQEGQQVMYWDVGVKLIKGVK
jgi:translation initiation factor 5A